MIAHLSSSATSTLPRETRPARPSYSAKKSVSLLSAQHNHSPKRLDDMNVSLKTPAGFDFKRTLNSHGWCELLPFEAVDSATLVRVLDVGDAAPVTVRMTGDRHGLNVSILRKLGKRALARVERDVRHIFRLDDRLEEFYAAVADEPEFAWIARDGAGRLLRSPTVFEDLVKSITTTNCSWALTRKMVTELVNNLGREAAGGL